MANSIKDLREGDTLVVMKHYFNKPGPHDLKITAIGRKWINLEGQIKVEKETLKGDGLTAYLSHDLYEESVSISRMRQRIAKAVIGAAVSDDQVKQIAAILGVNGDAFASTIS